MLFQRLHARGDFAGTGIGLSIARRYSSGAVENLGRVDRRGRFHFPLCCTEYSGRPSCPGRGHLNRDFPDDCRHAQLTCVDDGIDQVCRVTPPGASSFRSCRHIAGCSGSPKVCRMIASSSAFIWKLRAYPSFADDGSRRATSRRWSRHPANDRTHTAPATVGSPHSRAGFLGMWCARLSCRERLARWPAHLRGRFFLCKNHRQRLNGGLSTDEDHLCGPARSASQEPLPVLPLSRGCRFPQNRKPRQPRAIDARTRRCPPGPTAESILAFPSAPVRVVSSVLFSPQPRLEFPAQLFELFVRRIRLHRLDLHGYPGSRVPPG